MTQLTRYEMETVINYNDEGSECTVYTASKGVMRKLDKLCERHPETYECTKRGEAL